MSNIYGRYLMDSDGNYVDGNGYIIYTNTDASSALYYKEVENVGKYYTYNSSDKTYTEYSGSTSDYHKLGKDLFSEDETKRDAAGEEISKYGVIIVDNIAAVRTEVTEKSAEVVLAAVTKKETASLILSAGAGTEGSQALLNADNVTISADKIEFSDGTKASILFDTSKGKISADLIDTSSLTLDTLQSHDFSEVSGSEKGFKLDGSKEGSSFALYGTSPILDEEGNETEDTATWSITTGKVSLPAAFIADLTVERIHNWDGSVTSAIDKYFSITDGETENTKIMSLSKSVAKFIASDTDFVTHTLTTDDGNGGHVYIGKDFKNSEPGIIVYSDAWSVSHKNLNHQVTDSYTINSNKLTLTDTGSIKISKFGASFSNRIVGKDVQRTVSLTITLEGPSTKTLLSKSKTGTGASGGKTFNNDDDWVVEDQTITGLSAGEYYIKAV